MAKTPAKITASTTAKAKATAPEPARLRVDRHEGPGGIAVYWPVDDTRGLVRIGDMVPGVEYVVDAGTARRLVRVKGFRYVTPDDEAAAEAPVEPFNDATPDPVPAAATATGRGGIASTSQDQE